jgi:hypothetical protein
VAFQKLAFFLALAVVCFPVLAEARSEPQIIKPTKLSAQAVWFKVGIKASNIKRAVLRLKYKSAVRKRAVSLKKVKRAARQGKRVRFKKARSAKRPRLIIWRAASEPTPNPGEPLHIAPIHIDQTCSSDATGALQSWLDSVPDDQVAHLRENACYRIEGTISLTDKTLELRGHNARLKSFNPPSSHRSLIRATRSSLTLRRLNLIGSYKNGGIHNAALQWSHGVDLLGSEGRLFNVNISDMSGDCLYFGLAAGQRSTGSFHGGSCRRIGRNAVSVVAGDNILVEEITTNKIGFIAFDVEPNRGSGNGSRKATFRNNRIGDYVQKAWAVLGNAPLYRQRFVNNKITASKGLEIASADWGYRPKLLRIRGNLATKPAKHNAMNLDSIDDLVVRGNTVPIIQGGTMAQVRFSCKVSVFGNKFSPGYREASIVEPSC